MGVTGVHEGNTSLDTGLCDGSAEICGKHADYDVGLGVLNEAHEHVRFKGVGFEGFYFRVISLFQEGPDRREIDIHDRDLFNERTV